jgi:hypothetical protein
MVGLESLSALDVHYHKLDYCPELKKEHEQQF